MTATLGRGRRSRSATLAAPLALAAALLAGCGEDGRATATDPAAASSPASSSASPSGPASTSVDSSPSPAAEGPACSEVWVDGETLPGGYDGCYDDGRLVEPEGRYCEFGKPLHTHAGRFWSVPGGRISEVQGDVRRDAGYRDALAKCSA